MQPTCAWKPTQADKANRDCNAKALSMPTQHTCCLFVLLIWAGPVAYMRADAAYMRTADAAYMRMPLDRPIYALLNYPDGRCASAVALLARLT